MRVFIDSFVCSFVCFMISLATLNYLKVESPFHIAFSASFAVACFFAFFIIKNKKHKQYKLTQKENKLLKNFLDYLRIKNLDELYNDFVFYIEKAGYMPKKRKKTIILHEQKTYIYLLFKFDEVCRDEIIGFYKTTPKNYKSTVICSELNEEAKALCTILDIQIIEPIKIFSFLNKQNLLPNVSVNLTPKKLKLKNMLKECFNKKRCTHFFYVGIIMLVFSLFVFFPKYYLIVGTLFCIYGLICLFYGKKTT